MRGLPASSLEYGVHFGRAEDADSLGVFVQALRLTHLTGVAADPVSPVVRPRGDGRPIHRADWSYIWRPAVKAAGLPEGFGLRDLQHYFATVLIFGGAKVKTVQLAMGPTTPTVTLNTYVGYWADTVDQTRTLVDSALSCTGVVPTGTRHRIPAGQRKSLSGSS